VLEVGLGGRLDATNAVEADLAVITGVDLDHTKTLGSTMGSIAFEKGGIIKSGRPVVSGVVRQPALRVLRALARERAAAWIDARQAVRFTAESADAGLTFETDLARYDGLRLALAGRHQIDNARIALAAWERLAARLDVPVDPGVVRRGLAATRWPGRLDWRRDGTGPALLLDGAHNPQGARALAAELSRIGGGPPVVVFAAMEGKLLQPMLAALAPHVGAWVVTRPGVERALDTSELGRTIRETLGEVAIDERRSPVEALDHARRLAASRGSFVLVTGSLYLVGEVLGLLRGGGGAGPVSM
jgi:dihydrofolate synthase/folylpolyglutamate synthase